MELDKNSIEVVFESLRKGVVPDVGLDAFADGIQENLDEIKRNLKHAAARNGAVKFLTGGYGCGKTFMARLAIQEALKQDFAISMVVVSPNDTRFHSFDEVYMKVVGKIRTNEASEGAALYDIVDRWIGRIEDRIIGEGLSYDDPAFDERVRSSFLVELDELAKEDAGPDFISVLRAYFDAKQDGDVATANQLLSWASGSKNISSSIKKKAGIKGEISSTSAFTYLKGILSIIRKAGHPGLVIVMDEMETILRDRRDVREKSLNGLRQIIDDLQSYPGIFWIFTGTPEFFDTRRGVQGLAPLNDRIAFRKIGTQVNRRQPQLELMPFDKSRLINVALKLRELYPEIAEKLDRYQIVAKVSDEFIEKLVSQITSGLNADVGVVPRVFLREFVDILDTLDQSPDTFDPMVEYQFNQSKLSEIDKNEILEKEELEEEKTPYQVF